MQTFQDISPHEPQMKNNKRQNNDFLRQDRNIKEYCNYKEYENREDYAVTRSILTVQKKIEF
jgi:hypothetical protein